MVAMYAADYRKTRGFDLSLNGWGLEDLKFATTLVEAKVSNEGKDKPPWASGPLAVSCECSDKILISPPKYDGAIFTAKC